MEQQIQNLENAASKNCCEESSEENKSHNNNNKELDYQRDSSLCQLDDVDQLKKDLLLKADEFFNSGCAKIAEIENITIPLSSSSAGSETSDSGSISKFITMDFDGEIRIPLEHVEGCTDELKVLDGQQLKQLHAAKPTPIPYSNIDDYDMDSAEIIEKVLNLPPFDPNEQQVRFIIKHALSLNTISRSKDNVVQMFMPTKLKEYVKSENFNPMMDLLNTFAKHEPEEFCTFCSCKQCLAYREIAIHIMMEQIKATHMIVQLLEVLIKAYSPLLKNVTALNGFEKLLENKDIHWIASGLIYNQKYEHLDLIYDKTLTGPMILVLFSSILMVNNPMQLLQILSFHIKCIIKAFAVGIFQIPAEEKLAYIIDGFDHLCIISEQVASYLFIFEKQFLNKFSLSWVCLCQRLFHQHVYMKFFVAITNSGESLKNDDPLKNRYFDFAKRIICTDMRWNRAIWPKLQRYNLSEVEVKRRKCMLDVHHLIEAVVEDALRLPLEESSDVNVLYDIHMLENRRLAWQNIMAFAKWKYPNGFVNAPNTLVLDFRCEKCGAINEQHESKCKCVTCSIGGYPFLPPSKMKNICLDCLLKQRKTNDESQQNKSGDASSLAINETEDEDLKDLLCSFAGSKRSKDKTKQLTSNMTKMGFLERFFEGDLTDLGPEDPYHISWATFKHLSQRERFVHATIDEKYFCKKCNIPACMLARKLLNNEISPELTNHLVTHFHPLPLTKNELRSLIPNIVFYNQRLLASNGHNKFHNVIVKAYWTLIVSLYTTYFFDFETPTPLNLSAFEIDQSDIKLIPTKLTGDKEDTKFLEFLAAIRSQDLNVMAENFRKLPIQRRTQKNLRITLEKLIKCNHFHLLECNKNKTDLIYFLAKLLYSFAPPKGVRNPNTISEYLQRDDVKQQLENFLRSQEDRRIKILSMFKVSQASKTAEAANPIQQLSLNLEKPMSNSTAVTVQPTACSTMLEASPLPLNENQQKKNCNTKPKKCCLDHAADAEHCKDNHSGGKKRIKKDCSHLRINETRDRLRKKLQDSRKHQQQQQQQQQQQNHPIKHASSSSIQGQQSAGEIVTASAILGSHDGQLDINTELYEKYYRAGYNSVCPTTPPPFAEVLSKSATNTTVQTEKSEKVTGKAVEICDIIDNNKLKMKKWVDETLTYIEGCGPSAQNPANSNKKTQPQTTNPKKAAKKAKQKLRKEEEKRIIELHEIRAQFQDIYFKEFVEKIELKSLKNNGTGAGNKRRCDKKKISEIETNIKKLQRAKAKLESNILELIATVKQTNTDFKFPYLPTKEQQQAKLFEIEHAKQPQKFEDSSSINSAKQSSSYSSLSPPPKTVASNTKSVRIEGNGNVFNYASVAPSSKFFPNISFPYEMSFPGGGIQNSPHIGYTNDLSVPQNVGGPTCYSPPQQQTSPNVMINNNIKDNKSASETDPSKRIVTIRRVHNPNLPDSQVTVTARGNSANEDKLLYTFINGQMVPNPNTYNNAANEKILPPKDVPQLVSKSKLKKERKRKARLDLDKETNSSDYECGEFNPCERVGNVHLKPNNSKAKEKTMETSIVPLSQSKSHQCSKKQKVPINPTLAKENGSFDDIDLNSIPKTALKNAKKADKSSSQHSLLVERKELQKPSKKSQLDEQQSISGGNSKVMKKPAKVTTDSVSQKMPTPTPEVMPKEHRRHKLINHGQFDNNPYKTLHMQDSDSELEITASSNDEDSFSDIEIKDAAPIETVSKAKSKLKQQKPIENNQKIIKGDNNKAIVQNKLVQHKKSNTSVSGESKLYSNQSVNEQQKIKPIVKMMADNQISNHTDLNHHGSSTNRNAKHKENKGKTFNMDKSSTLNNRNDRNGNSASNTKNLKTKTTYQTASQRNGKLPNENKTSTQTKTQTLKKNASSNSSLNSNVASKTSVNDSKLTPSKRMQRSKKKQDQQSHSYFTDCTGIPEHMEHFNPNEVNIIRQGSNLISQKPDAGSLTQQFQRLQIAQDVSNPKTDFMPSYASVSANKLNLGGSSLSTVSIMDQLNRGVQVENLSLPPGITLTKVDPIKSEQLRQKSESIKRLSQPLQPSSTNVPITSGGFQQHSSTIIAPPVASYLPAQYISSSSAISGAVPLDQGNIIMVENISANSHELSEHPSTGKQSTKGSSKSKRRRNKGKRTDENVLKDFKSNKKGSNENEQQPNMITLRNPMFHGGPAAAANILQQPGLFASRQGFGGESPGASFHTPLPMDQPAAIIKNENGMFTIRNPALHQAVTNGLALSGYRQFGGNVSYYTPQEAVAEAARAAQHQVLMQKARLQATGGSTESFSYFSNNPTTIANPPQNTTGPKTVSAATSPTKPSNKMSITCSSVNNKNNVNTTDDRNEQNENVKFDLNGFSTSSSQRCISAIGSEKKNNRNSSNTDILWSEYGQQENLSRSHENLSSISTSMENNSTEANAALQDKCQHAIGHGNQISGAVAAAELTHSANSLFDATIKDAHIDQQHYQHHHMHHSCGDDSPPPTLLGYSSSYLDDIPNTGVIRYDDASFLKNLIPGQRLNKEVSIHNINESNHGRITSPMSHLVEITPVYSGNGKLNQPQNLQSKIQQYFPPTPATYSNTYQKNFNEFDPNIFPNSSNSYGNMNNSDTNDTSNMTGNVECEPYKIFNYDFEAPSSSIVSRQKSIAELNNMFTGNNFNSAVSHRASPFLDDTTMENFVQNLSALEIGSKPGTRSSVEHCSQQQQQQLNGGSGRNSVVLGNTSNSNSANSTPASGWW